MAVLTRRVLLIINPGSRRGARRQRDALSAFGRANISCDAVETERPGHAADVAARTSEKYIEAYQRLTGRSL